MNHSPLIFVQLNEVNFDFVEYYVRKYNDLPAFASVLSTFQKMETRGEDAYEELEPWIQWVSAQTGKTYGEHGIFRLGDVVKAPDDLVQVFEVLEERGLRVGAISPMNARNLLKHPAYFIPDPWTDTPADASGFSTRLSAMLRQTVNENASGRISVGSVLTLLEAMVYSFSLRGTPDLIRAIAATLRQPWTKALVLDRLIHLVHLRLCQRQRPDVSFVFLNAGAHIQHHYMLNAEPAHARSRNPTWYVPADADPVRDMLKAYDRILGDYLELQKSGARVLIATGLTQVPYERVKFYYRLKNHFDFLKLIGTAPVRVLPRMTRDFEVEFANEAQAALAAEQLAVLTLERDSRLVFGEIDRRGTQVFITLTYPDEIRMNDTLVLSNGDRLLDFGTMVTFVAIKNGMHSTRGFAFLSPNAPVPSRLVGPCHVARLFEVTLSVATSRP
jgi:hypothetical protein